MSEADDKRLAIIRNAVENTGYVNCEPNPAFLLRLLDAAREENARIKAFLSEGDRQTLDSEMAWKARATRAESALAASDGEKASLQECVTDWQDRAVAAESALADCKDDYLRRHNDACDRYMEIVSLKSALAEARERVGELETLLCDIRDGLRADGHVWLRAEDGREMGPPVRDFINAALTPSSPDGSETPDA